MLQVQKQEGQGFSSHVGMFALETGVTMYIFVVSLGGGRQPENNHRELLDSHGFNW